MRWSLLAWLIWFPACQSNARPGCTALRACCSTLTDSVDCGTQAAQAEGSSDPQAACQGLLDAYVAGGQCAAQPSNPPDNPGAACQLSDACSGGLVCDHTSGTCVECRASSDCGAGQVCRNHACQAATTCQSDLQCRSLNMVCDASAGHCVECNAATDCPANTGTNISTGQACLGHSCIAAKACTTSLACGTNLVCATGNPPAWPGTFLGKGCAECASNNDCPADEACQEGLCVKVCYRAQAKCGVVEGASCGTCASGGLCASTGTVCLQPLGGSGPFGGFSGSEGLVATPDAVYTATRDQTSLVYRIDRASGRTTTAATVNGYLNTLTANATDLFWGEGPHIWRLSKQGGSATAVHTFGTSDDCYSVAADDQYAYCHINQSSPSWFGIYQVPLAGGNPIQLTDPNQLIDVGSMVSHGGRLYWDDIDPPGLIAFTPIGGGAVRAVARVQNLDGGLLVDDNFVYWGSSDGVSKAPAGGNGSVTSLASLGAFGNSSWRALALVGGDLYAGGSGLVKIDVATGAMVTLLSDQDGGVDFVAADAATVFISNSQGVFELQQL